MPAERPLDVSKHQETFERKILDDKERIEWTTPEEYDAMITEIANSFISQYEIVTPEDVDGVEYALQIGEDNSATPNLNEIIVRARELIG